MATDGDLVRVQVKPGHIIMDNGKKAGGQIYITTLGRAKGWIEDVDILGPAEPDPVQLPGSPKVQQQAFQSPQPTFDQDQSGMPKPELRNEPRRPHKHKTLMRRSPKGHRK